TAARSRKAGRHCASRPSGAKEGGGAGWAGPRSDKRLMLLVTGGAGFIGSNVVASLNEAGRSDVAVCDWLGQDGKWRNLQKRQLADVIEPAELSRWREARKLEGVSHMGRVSSTSETDGDAGVDQTSRRPAGLIAGW